MKAVKLQGPEYTMCSIGRSQTADGGHHRRGEKVSYRRIVLVLIKMLKHSEEVTGQMINWCLKNKNCSRYREKLPKG